MFKVRLKCYSPLITSCAKDFLIANSDNSAVKVRFFREKASDYWHILLSKFPICQQKMSEFSNLCESKTREADEDITKKLVDSRLD